MNIYNDGGREWCVTDSPAFPYPDPVLQLFYLMHKATTYVLPILGLDLRRAIDLRELADEELAGIAMPLTDEMRRAWEEFRKKHL